MRGRDRWGPVLLVMGAGSLLNAAWMLLAPAHWYARLPAAVPDFGPFNVHFVRDIGCAFFTVGVALVWAARRAALRFPLVAVAAVFFGAHAVLHVRDTLAGVVEVHHWLLDAPGVYLPAVVLVIAAFAAAPEEKTP